MLKAGFSRVDVTPPLWNFLAGYFNERRAEGILDPIELNALAVSDGVNVNVIISADFLGIMEEYATPLRISIAEGAGIPADHIMISATHSHTSIRLGVEPWKYSIDDESYMDVLRRKFVDVAKMAINDLSEATVSIALQETAEQLSFIRRYRMKDGTVETNPGKCNPDIDRPIGTPDNTVRLVKFSRQTGNDIALVNFSTHPDVIGGNKFSADWPGFVRRYVEKDIGRTNCILVTGAQGDTNHLNIAVNARQGGYGYSAHMGRVIADTVIDIWNNTRPVKDVPVFSEVSILMTPSNRAGSDNLDYYKRVLDDYYNKGTKYKIADLAIARRLANFDATPPQLKLPVTVMGFSDIVFVGFGGEPFSEYAEWVRKLAGQSFAISCCCSNGQQGYLPTADAFAEGGYEACASLFTSQMPSDVMNAVEDMLNKYISGRKKLL